MKVFTCPRCKEIMEGFPSGHCYCGFVVPAINGVYQFTDDVPFNADDGDLNWFGYEQVGENYEPGYLHNKEADTIGSSHNLAAFLGDGKVIMDIGAGLGASAISFALAGLKVIAADISQAMLEIAIKRAKQHDANQILFARMNGFKLALADNSIDAVLEVDMLHQVNHPEMVIAEILRVLKPGGYFLQYGAWTTIPPYTTKQQTINEEYDSIQKDIEDYYKEALDEAGFSELLFSFSSWERANECKKKHFTLHTTLTDTGCYDIKNRGWTLDMGLHKTKTRASGVKQQIPLRIHETAWAKTDRYAKNKYGDNYGSIQRYYTSRSGIHVYKLK